MSMSPPDYWEYEGSRRKPRWLPDKTPAPSLPLQPEPYVQPPDSGVSVRAATEALQAAPDIDRFTEVFEHTVDDAHGAFAQMHQFLDSGANWCRDRGALGSAGELESWALRLEELIEDVRLLPESLAIESVRQPGNEHRSQAAPGPHTPTGPALVRPADSPPAPAAAPPAAGRR
ncbi:hypothetical protein ACIQPR_46125 [Streptomyces sp. NPDC091280]|uniref:hypothetical protein n=1 Tax=Streptomyces sp. NPDC091280 TaxID=3365984 RepID=UPI003828C73B